MASGRSRSAPCFCGSGRPFKHCCLRSLKQVRTIDPPGYECRWRIWRAYGGGAPNLATREVAEHTCNGEFIWIAGETAEGTTWMVDDCPVTLMEVIDATVPPMADWVVDQTLTALQRALAEVVELSASVDEEAFRRTLTELADDGGVEEIIGLLLEFSKFVAAARVANARFEHLCALSGTDDRGADVEHKAA
jgi:hypothetical protein